MNRSDLQKLADLRVKEANILLDNECYEGAYYLLGYAVECALKSCIAKQIKQHDFPDLKLVRDSYTHDFEKLINISGLKGALQAEMSVNPAFGVNWGIAKDWSEEARYEETIGEARAKDFFTAVTATSGGILPWLKNWW